MSILSQYQQARSDAAFKLLVDRYVGIVYAAARRQTRDSHLADDVTQAVFILLSQKAARIPADRPLSAWLLQTTAYCAANARRARARRTALEQKAATMAQNSNNQSADDQQEAWKTPGHTNGRS